MLYLNKLLPVFVLPLGLVLLLLLVGIWRKKRWVLILAVVLLWVSSMPFVGNRLFHWLESRYRPIALDRVEKVDAVVPLGGILGPPSAEGLHPNVGEANERLEAGIELWRHAKADWLVFTGGRIPWANQSETEGEACRRLAISRGIPPAKIIVTSEVGNTADEAKALAKLARDRGWHRIILVTSSWHRPRAARLFRKAGVDFVPYPVDFQINRRRPWTLLDFLPQVEALMRTDIALRETYGILFYALIGRG
jgi:uncharacterized SAM-binding protein YcdF (DUF218 family)